MTEIDRITICRPSEEEIPELGRVVGQALTFRVDTMQEWVGLLGRDNMRMARRGESIIGGLGIIWMGQWFGGVSVPVAGITAVGVAAEERGKGVALSLLRAMLQEVYDAGVPLSSLYPATLGLYRRAGYELAGSKLVYELPLHAISARERTLQMIPVGPEQHAEIQQAYAQRARLGTGNIDRTPLLWQRALEHKEKVLHTLLFVRDGQTEGYVTYFQPEYGTPLQVQELCLLTADAGRQALTLFSDHRSMLKTVTWRGAPQDPLIGLLPEVKELKIQDSFDWMLRVISVPGALAARGYPSGVEAELHLSVRDALLPQNNRRFVLSVAGGRGMVQEGGHGSLELDIRGLSALYSGYISPYDLRIMGLLDGPDAALASAAALFMGPRPWIVEIF